MRPLDGKSILIVEDQFLIAMDVATVLEKAGARATIADSAARAIRLLEQGGLSAAVLDQTASNKGDLDMRAELVLRRVPHIIYSGNVTASEHDADVPRISKPAADEVLVKALQRAMREPCGTSTASRSHD